MWNKIEKFLDKYWKIWTGISLFLIVGWFILHEVFMIWE